MPDALSAPIGRVDGGATPSSAPSPPTISGADGFNALEPGKEFIDPDGVRRRKPYVVKDKASFDAVPEGAEFADPEGMLRIKPANEGVDFTTQTLYNMARTDEERRAILGKRYGEEAVKQDDQGLYAEDGGKRYRPGFGDKTKRAAALVASEAAPVAGAVLGEIGGAAAGTAIEPGGGTLAGAVGGGYAGGMAGQGFNDMVLALAGVHRRGAGEEVRDLAVGGIGGGVGTGIGRAAPVIGAAGKEAINLAQSGLAPSFAKLAGATPEGVSQAAELAEKGVKVPPSSWLPELPYIHKLVETFDPAFRKQNVLAQSQEQYYGREAGQILDQLGVPAPREPVTAATAKVSSERAGQMSLDKVRSSMAEEDARLDASIAQAKAAAAARATAPEQARQATIEKLQTDAATNREMAQKAIDEGFNMIRADSDAAVKAAGVGENPGDMVRAFAGKIQTLRQGIRVRAGKLYSAADAAAGDARPDVADLKASADEFLDSLPEPFKQKHPDIVKNISNLEEGQTTFGQLHALRSMLRQDLDHTDLTPSMRDGVFKMFSGKIDATLKAAQEGGVESPELRSAYDMLRKADDFYAKNMPRFQDEKIRGIVEATKAGMPMNPELLAKEVFQPGYTERMGELRKIVGKPLWSAVQAADTKAMLDGSRTLVPGEISAGEFASQVLDRYQTGVLEAGYDKATADRLMTQARRVVAAEGKLPLKYEPGDTVVSMLRKADAYLNEAETLAKTDPLGTLQKEMRRLEGEHRKEVMALRQSRKGDPLNFLFNANAGPIKSADRILSDPDMMIAAAHRFGEQSPEFTALRQVYAHRLLQRSFEKTGNLQTDFAKITPEVQDLVFPGVSLDAAKQLAKDMNFLMGDKGGMGDAGGSMAAASRVLHPWGSIGKYSVSLLPGADTLGRVVLGKYYQLVSWGTTHPAFIRWVERGLQGNEVDRAAVRDAVQKVLASGNTAGALGAGGGEALMEVPEQP